MKDVRAAFVTAILSLAYSLSTSALIFTGPIQIFLGVGLAAALVTATLSSAITSFGSGFKIAIASPTSTIAAALAVTVAALDPVLSGLPGPRALALVLTILTITTLTTGLMLLAIGIGRLGKIVRFIPFPVVAGFMGISGWLLASGAIRMTTQSPIALSAIPTFLQPTKAIELGVVVAWAGVLGFAARRFKNPATTPLLLVGAVLFVNVLNAAVPLKTMNDFLADAMFHTTSHVAIALPFFSDMFSRVDWPLLVPLIPNVLAVVFITVLTALLTCTGLESALDVDGDLDRELKVQGAANVACALFGGYVGLISVGSTLAAKSAGAKGRLVGCLTGVVCLCGLLGGQTLVNDIPRFLVGGLQLQIGAQVLWTWCIASRTKMPLSEWLLVIGIVTVAAWFGFVPAVLCGIVGGCIIFAVDVSRIDVVRRLYAINERSSPLVRSAAETAVLARDGESVKIVELNGFLFFGSAYQLLSKIKALQVAGELRLVILDFTAVTGADSSTTTVLGRLDKTLRRHAVPLVFAGVKPEVAALLMNSRAIDSSTLILADRNAALEYAEGFVLSQAGTSPASAIPLTTWLAQSLGRFDFAELLLTMLEVEDRPAGSYLCRQGEPTDSLIFIETGRVGVMIGSGDREICVRVFGPHTIAGEQGFILKQPRTASLKVEEDARIWSLQRSTYDDLLVTNVDLVIALMRDIVRVQSERLIFATRHNAAMAG